MSFLTGSFKDELYVQRHSNFTYSEINNMVELDFDAYVNEIYEFIKRKNKG